MNPCVTCCCSSHNLLCLVVEHELQQADWVWPSPAPWSLCPTLIFSSVICSRRLEHLWSNMCTEKVILWLTNQHEQFIGSEWLKMWQNWLKYILTEWVNICWDRMSQNILGQNYLWYTRDKWILLGREPGTFDWGRSS